MVTPVLCRWAHIEGLRGTLADPASRREAARWGLLKRLQAQLEADTKELVKQRAAASRDKREGSGSDSDAGSRSNGKYNSNSNNVGALSSSSSSSSNRRQQPLWAATQERAAAAASQSQSLLGSTLRFVSTATVCALSLVAVAAVLAAATGGE